MRIYNGTQQQRRTDHQDNTGSHSNRHVLVRTLQHLWTVSEKILHQKDGDGIDSYSHSDHTQRPKAHSQGAESCKVVDDSGQNAKAEPQPVDERSWGQATEVDLFGCLDSYVRSRARQGSNGGRLQSC